MFFSSSLEKILFTSICSTQLEQQSNQNRDLGDELRHLKLESNTLQRSLNDSQLAMRERDRLQGVVMELQVCIQEISMVLYCGHILQGELNTLRQELKANDTRYNDAQFLRNKVKK